MINFSRLNYRKGFADLLNYAVLLEDGVVLTKDGGLLAGVSYYPGDLSSVMGEELNEYSSRLNRLLCRFGTGWSVCINAVRVLSGEYSSVHLSHFPDPVTQYIDDVRREYYSHESLGHYDTRYYLLLYYLPPRVTVGKLKNLLYEDVDDGRQNKDGEYMRRVVEEFVERVGDFVGALSVLMLKVEVLKGYEVETEDGVFFRDALVDHLHYCVTSLNHPINLFPQVDFLDSVLGRQNFTAGLEPRVGDFFISVVSIDGFPSSSYPLILAGLDELSLEYRWCTRFMFLDRVDARSKIEVYRRKWSQKVRGMIGQIFNREGGQVSADAMAKVGEADGALADLDGDLVRFGYYTSVLVLRGGDRRVLDEQAKFLVNEINGLGFSARLEKVNAVEAFLGSLPGMDSCNVRKPMIHTLNLSDLIPVSAVFNGKKVNPSNMYPEGSSPLFYADTGGGSIFRFNLHVSDLGHTLIIGPTGSGKSTLLAFIAAQFRRYKGAKVFVFDKGYSMYTLTAAVKDAQHYDIGLDSSLSFAPLFSAVKGGDKTWFKDWISGCCRLQLNGELTPQQKNVINDAVEHVFAGFSAGDITEDGLGLSEFSVHLQDVSLSEAFRHYTKDGAAGYLLDSQRDSLSLSNFVCFELEDFMNMADVDKLPVLDYIFYRLEKALDGSPALIVLDEAWLMLGHKYFAERIREWLKVMRKNNCAVVLATQSLSDAVDSGILDVIIESTATKVFLPNPSALSDVSRDVYRGIGLNDTEIAIVGSAEPKRQYYVKSAYGNRLIELSLSEEILRFVGKSGVEQKRVLDKLIEVRGEGWLSDYFEKKVA